ncbi:flagellar basal body rod protein FlgC [Oceaniglobus ichthyenteri]|uniref:flagellar basal body rod protein FlgC n=1 Tax=Oceaniglobus ichthyenteri TaxID=2136177 RepID=UPI000D3ABF85|nr:flagellar basal body rod protein FlgC [Oceaniglobus ichthyenteri]
MSNILNALSLSASGMDAQASRLRHVSENIANADTPGYRRKTVSFDSDMRAPVPGTVSVGKVALDKSELSEMFDPGHPLADANGKYQGSNVDILIEIADAREAQRSYDANLKIFDQARQMSQGLLELLRR